MRQELGINLLVYKEQLEKGMPQSSLLRTIKEQGISLAEVRREYILDEAERIAISKAAENLHMDLYYSVPEKIMENDSPNEQLGIYLEEAKCMNVKNVKFNIGSLYKATKEGVEKLKEIIELYDMTITIENDQTEENGTFQCTKEAIDTIQKFKLPIGYTMDLGNWYWQKEDPEQAFEELSDQISIFHLKNIAFLNEKPETVMLENGSIPWKSMIGKLDDSVKVFLEYPISMKEVTKQIEVVKEAE